MSLSLQRTGLLTAAHMSPCTRKKKTDVFEVFAAPESWGWISVPVADLLRIPDFYQLSILSTKQTHSNNKETLEIEYSLKGAKLSYRYMFVA